MVKYCESCRESCEHLCDPDTQDFVREQIAKAMDAAEEVEYYTNDDGGGLYFRDVNYYVKQHQDNAHNMELVGERWICENGCIIDATGAQMMEVAGAQRLEGF